MHLMSSDPSQLRAAVRCGAKTRNGAECRSPAVSGKARCRMHGGARGSGAPRGNQNALKHGGYTRDAVDKRREVNALLRSVRSLVEDVRRE